MVEIFPVSVLSLVLLLLWIVALELWRFFHRGRRRYSIVFGFGKVRRLQSLIYSTRKILVPLASIG